jgi:phosphocarrier protein FPr
MSVMDTLLLLAPISGPLLPLEEVPDPVFAQKMVGDGVSIDPVSSRLVSPCDAEVLSVHPSGHAITLRTNSQVDLILHIGLDTVALRGEGFLPLKKNGDRVRAGEPLIDFAADYVATHAPSLLTQMVISSMDRIVEIKTRTGYAEAGRDVVIEAILPGAPAPDAPKAPEGNRIASKELRVLDPTGLHARPAAVIASTARTFHSDIRVRRGNAEANARSVTAIMGLEIAGGDTIVFTAAGDDAQAALDTLAALVESGLVQAGDPHDDGETRAITPAYAPICTDPDRCLTGAAASPGVAIGRVVHLAAAEVVATAAIGTTGEEREKLERALVQARQQLAALSGPTAGSTVQAGIFRAHLELLDDPDLVEVSRELIAGGSGAVAAWQSAFSRLADRMAEARSDLFAQRAADVRDVGRRVLRVLAGSGTVEGGAQVYPADAVIVAQELTPSDAAGFDRSRVRAFCTVGGGKTSHVAILARSLGIPAVAAIDRRALQTPPGTLVIVDGTNGSMVIDPTGDEMSAAHALIDRDAARREAVAAAAHQPGVTLDGTRIEVAANVGASSDAVDGVRLGAEGVGLLRSEFLFVDRPDAPDEEEQYEAYSRVVTTFGPAARVIIRTLDVGGDKPLSYLPLPREDNPFLGIRGIRIAVQREDLLRLQLRAILRASRHGRVHVMFPMITNLEEWRHARRVLEEERAGLGVEPVPAGIMVEVPAVALTADAFAAEVDFFSIGTNDLTQYTLAMDRGHPALAAQVDALHPAVLQLIARTADAARAHGRWVGVCGAVAGEEAAVPILLGLGVTELSVSAPVVPAIKARIRSLRISDCRAVARAALRAPTAADVRALVRS